MKNNKISSIIKNKTVDLQHIKNSLVDKINNTNKFNIFYLHIFNIKNAIKLVNFIINYLLLLTKNFSLETQAIKIAL